MTTEKRLKIKTINNQKLVGNGNISLPTDASDLTDNSNTAFTPKSHTHGNIQDDGKIKISGTAQASKNVVTDSSGNITTEEKPTIPSASSTTPTADSTNGAVGTGTTWARSNHSHPKSSIYAEATHSHTKSQISDFPTLSTVATSGSYNDLTDKPNIPQGSTVDTELSTSSNNAIANSTVTTALNGKSDSGHTHNNYLTSSDISGKIDTAGTGLSKSNTTLNHSNSVTALTTASLKKVKYDAQGHITGTSDVSGSDLPSHTHNYSTFSGSYSDLTNKPSYTATITSSSTGAYKIGSINISGSSVDIYGKDTNTEYSHPTYSNVAKSTSALYKIKTNSLGHIIEITEATSTDIANLGVEITDTVYTHPSYTSKTSGLYKITVNSTGHISATASVNASDLPNHTHDVSEIETDYINSSGYATYGTLDDRLDVIENKDSINELVTALQHINTNYEYYS